jgi:NAD(P)-dependent dehydrogenase (short-subunit alcohol dehydrogenase family)
MYKDLKDKVIIISGGSGFLGMQFCKSFLKAKSFVIILDKKKPRYSNKRLFFFKCDITNEFEIRKFSRLIIKKFKEIKALINCAAIDYNPKNKINIKDFKLENFNLDIWDRDINVGLKGSLITTKIFGTIMSNQKSGGKIINVSSDLGIIAPDQRIYKNFNFIKPITYSAIKHAIIGLTKYTAAYWANKKVYCNAIAPGGMENGQDIKFIKKISSLIPLGRMAKKNELNSLVEFLSSEASDYITGSTIVIDGGRSII